MKVVCFAGFSGAGKTTLLERLIPALKALGQRVSVLKHAHHQFDIDHPGKDSYRHRKAGAYEVLIASERRVALMRELELPVEHNVHDLLAQLSADIDWVLVEGFKHSDLPKVEIWRPSAGKPALYPHDARVQAIVTDEPASLPAPTALPVLDLNDAVQLAAWLTQHTTRFDYSGPD